MMAIEIVHPSQIRAVWPFVRKGLESLPADEWIPEDVYHCVKSGDSALYLCKQDDAPVAFFILRRRVAEFSGDVWLHVWIAYSEGDADVYDESVAVIRQVAAQAGAARITLESPRKGWAKRYPVISTYCEIPL